MSETKFTKGPWSYHQSNASRFASIKSRDKSVFVFRCEPRNMHDVKLIAAAPELYEALDEIVRTVVKGIPLDVYQIMKASSLLAKARGES